MRRTLFLFLLLYLFITPAYLLSAIMQINISGSINPGTAAFVKKGVQSALEKHAELIVIQLDTPGGLDSAMRSIIKTIAASTVPVAVYVAPTGARAASAGTYILYAAHIAAMAPGTNIGAATPVTLGRSAKEEKSANETNRQNKVIHDATSYIQSLAELRERNVSWAAMAVKAGKSITAQGALKLGIIDTIALNVHDLLNKIDGKKIVVDNQSVTLHTKNVPIDTISPDWKDSLLATIADPTVAYILLLVGIYGLIFEFMTPGAIGPGIIGGISLIFGMYALAILPTNFAALALLLFGLGCMVAEAFLPSFGMLGVGGIVAFIGGSVLLFDTKTIDEGISMPLIIALSIFSMLFLLLVIKMMLKSRKLKKLGGEEEMLGASGVVVSQHKRRWNIRIHGEIWEADSEKELHVGDEVTVKGIQGLRLSVEPIIHKEE